MSNDDNRSYRGGPIIAVAVVLLLPVAYVGAYFALTELRDANRAPMREFNASWQVAFFRPALMVEKRCRGNLFIAWSDGEYRKVGESNNPPVLPRARPNPALRLKP